jgi:hypothetical protein
MARFQETRIRRMPAVCGLAVAAMLLLTAGQAQAAATVYPAGGSTFTGGAEGWQATTASCTVSLPALCTADGGYDGANGNSPGSLAANTAFTVNLLSLFQATVTLQSPDFTVADGGSGTLRLERQFVPGDLINVSPQLTYTETLIDRTAGTQVTPLTETVTGASPFTAKNAAVPVIAGHTYAISISAVTSSTAVGTDLLLSAKTNARFDNVSLSAGGGGVGGGGSGENGGSGGGGNPSDSRLLSLIDGSLVPPAALRGNKITVKAKCPARVGTTCRITLRGVLSKKKPATSSRKAKVARGKTKRFVLRVKPNGLKKVSQSKRLLFKETVRAGSAKATVYKRLKLVHRG